MADNDTKFGCSMCNSRFSQKKDLYKHLRAKHGKDTLADSLKETSKKRKCIACCDVCKHIHACAKLCGSSSGNGMRDTSSVAQEVHEVLETGFPTGSAEAARGVHERKLNVLAGLLQQSKLTEQEGVSMIKLLDKAIELANGAQKFVVTAPANPQGKIVPQRRLYSIKRKSVKSNALATPNAQNCHIVDMSILSAPEMPIVHSTNDLQ